MRRSSRSFTTWPGRSRPRARPRATVERWGRALVVVVEKPAVADLPFLASILEGMLAGASDAKVSCPRSGAKGRSSGSRRKRRRDARRAPSSTPAWPGATCSRACSGRAEAREGRRPDREAPGAAARVRSRSRAPRTPGGPYPPRAAVRPSPLELATPLAAFRPSSLPPPEALTTTTPPQPEPLPLPIAPPLPPIQTRYTARPEVPSGLFVMPQPHPSGVRAASPRRWSVIELEIDPDLVHASSAGLRASSRTTTTRRSTTFPPPRASDRRALLPRPLLRESLTPAAPPRGARGLRATRRRRSPSTRSTLWTSSVQLDPRSIRQGTCRAIHEDRCCRRSLARGARRASRRSTPRRRRAVRSRWTKK